MELAKFKELIKILDKVEKVIKPTYVRQDDGDEASLIVEFKIEDGRNN